MIRTILGWLTGGVLDRILTTIDKRIDAQADREAIKGEIIKEHYRSRADWMRAGGFWLMLLFAVPLAIWWAAVILYSLAFCASCFAPQPWSIAALPSPLDEWAGGIVISIFGVIGVSRWRNGG